MDLVLVFTNGQGILCCLREDGGPGVAALRALAVVTLGRAMLKRPEESVWRSSSPIPYYTISADTGHGGSRFPSMCKANPSR
jgi:hypothetical protein